MDKICPKCGRTSEQLLDSCPFCGGSGTLMFKPGSWGYYPTSAGVVCKDIIGCRARGPVSVGQDDTDTSCKDKAIRLWNTRAGEA